MLETALTYSHGALLLIYGVFLSGAFSGVRFTKKNVIQNLLICTLCGLLQIVCSLTLSLSAVWKLYPVITHLPLIIFLCTLFGKRLVTSAAAVFTVYLFCQPAKWLGLLLVTFTGSPLAEYWGRFAALALISFISLKYLASYFSDIFNKDTRSVCIFGIVPLVYYLFDYATVIYTDLWMANNRVVAEFLPFFLGIVFVLFCVVYYREYEQKTEAEQNEHFARIAVEQQTRELQAIKRSAQETHLLRHDMRHHLTMIESYLSAGKPDQAEEYIKEIQNVMDSSKPPQRYCENEMVNLLCGSFYGQAVQQGVNVAITMKLPSAVSISDAELCSILSNGFENALHAVLALDKSQRRITLSCEVRRNKLLIEISNPFFGEISMKDGLPVTRQRGHGYGCYSIRSITEKNRGLCTFAAANGVFTLRIVLPA